MPNIMRILNDEESINISGGTHSALLLVGGPLIGILTTKAIN